MTHTKLTKDKIRKARLGTHQSPETIEKIRQAMLERAEMVRQGLLPAYHHSAATKAKMRKAARHRKPSKKAIQNRISNAKDFQSYLQTLEYSSPGYVKGLRKDPATFKKLKEEFKKKYASTTN